MKEEEILQKVLDSLVKDFERLEKELATCVGYGNLSKLTSSKDKVSRTILDCLSFQRDPKFTTITSRAKKDLASLLAELGSEDDKVVEGEKRNQITFKESRKKPRKRILMTRKYY